MSDRIDKMLPEEIEKRSFEIISRELGDRKFDPWEDPVIKRVIHTTADFEYADNLFFSSGAVERGVAAIKGGASIVTDTQMAAAGINKKVLKDWGGQVYSFMSDPDVAEEARERKVTRAVVCMERAAGLGGKLIIALGNAPTALIHLYELMEKGKIRPELVIGAPVGFVNVIESKELIMKGQAPCIIARGRKGGSNVAAAICNALLYQSINRKL